MKLVTNSLGEKVITFKTQHGTEGSVNLGVCSDEQAQTLSEAIRVKELETVSSIVNLTHEVVTQIVAGKKITVADAVDAWEQNSRELQILSPTTLRTNRNIVDVWMREKQLADKPISAVGPVDVSSYVNAGEERRSTAVRKLSAIRQFLKFCHENGYITRNPAGVTVARVNYDSFKHNELEKTEKETFTNDEVEKLLSVANPFWFAAITIALETGLRLGDIAKLQWASFANDRLVVWTEKANKRVDMVVPPSISYAVGRVQSTDIEYCFPEQRALILDPDKRAQLSMQFLRLCRKAGVQGKSFHSLRHTNATNLVASGENIERVAARLGHSSTETTRGYVHVGNSRTPT